MLFDGQDKARLILIFIVTELLGSFLCRDESSKRKKTWAPVRWSVSLKIAVLDRTALLWNKIRFTGGKYDLNMLKKYFVKEISFSKERYCNEDVFAAKKENDYVSDHP